MNQRKINPYAKFVLEFGPIIGFFLAYLWLKDRSFEIGGTVYEGFIVVTAGFIPVFLLSIAALWWLTGKLSRMQVLTAVLVVIFGGLSVWLNDERFFKVKPTLVYLLFALVLTVGLLRGRSWLEYAMGELMPMSEEGWMILTKRMTVLFFGLAAANELVWRTQSTETWVWFETFALPAAVFAFFIAQSGLFKAHGIEDEEEAE